MRQLFKVCLTTLLILFVTFGVQPVTLAAEVPTQSLMPLEMKHPNNWCAEFCFINGIQTMQKAMNAIDDPQFQATFQEVVLQQVRGIIAKHLNSPEEYPLQPESVAVAIKTLEDAGYTVN